MLAIRGNASGYVNGHDAGLPANYIAVTKAVPISEEITGALGAFFHGGIGPSHAKLSGVFRSTGNASSDPYDQKLGTPSKQVRVHTVMDHAAKHATNGRQLVESLLTQLRIHRCFDPSGSEYDSNTVKVVQRAFARSGWTLSDDGELTVSGAIDLETGGREALDEQLKRLQGATEDPGLLLGAAKDLLESVAKYVLEETGFETPKNPSFPQLLYLARDRIDLTVEKVASSGPAAAEIRQVLGAAWQAAEAINGIRKVQGVGHGRTLPTGVSPEMAIFVVRQSCFVAELMLRTLDRRLGH